MNIFLALTGFMSLLALLFVAMPLFRKRAVSTIDQDALNAEIARARMAELELDLGAGRIEQAQYDAAREDLEQELLSDLAGNGTGGKPARNGSWAVLLVALAVPVGAILLYKSIGNERIIALLEAQPASPRQQQQQQNAGQLSVEEMVERLAARMESDPDNLEGWVMLARSYSMTSQYSLAVPAFRNILRLGGGDSASLLADFADALVATSNGRFTDESSTLLTRALALEPGNIKVLWLAGHWKNQSGDAATAINYWQRAAQQMAPDSKDWQIITRQIEQVRSQTGLPADSTVVADSSPTGAAEPAATATLTVTVSLDPALRESVRPNDTVFIFARAVNGPRMPLAIVRKQVSDLPVTVTLDDSMAMTPAMVLSAFDPVTIGARISRSGNAIPQSGDLQGNKTPVSTQADARLDVLIDATVP
ncbi:MAG: c-type cytochrome biogenesis protein CcmI [Gammaproteobacteria bacterium]|nr:c-type cytochrome biogenesis protein CcmI [Gammaproteobacteria bacterium]